MPLEIVLLAVEDCVALSVYGPTDLFHTANLISRQTEGEEVDFQTKIVTPDGKPVRSSSGHTIVPDGAFSDAQNATVIMLPGIGVDTPELLAHKIDQLHDISKQLRELKDTNSIFTASCTGALLLGSSGLLDGKRATATWWIEPVYREMMPKVELCTNEILVDDGQVITAAAGTSSLDLSLHLISRLVGSHLARLVAQYMVIDGGRESQLPYMTPWHNRTRQPFIEEADAWIRKNLAEPKPIADLASYLGLSSRTLLRRFREHTNMTPQAYIQNTRVEQAKVLLESARSSISQTGADVGFGDENAFRRAFSNATGLTPTQYRGRFTKTSLAD